MPKQKLIATRGFTYATRHLVAGEAFEAKPRDARILKAIGKARDDYDAPVQEALAQSVAPVAPPPVTTAPAPAPVMSATEEHAHDPLDALRAEAAALGLHVDRRWGEVRLMQEIDDAREKVAEDAPTSSESSETETPAEEPHEAVAMTTDSASALMPHPYRNEAE